MGVPPEVLQQMMARGGQGGAPGGQPPPGAPPGGAPPGAGAPAGQASPAAAPMAAPQEKQGKMAAASTNVHIAMNMLEEALPAFGSESDEGKAVMKALTALSKLAAKRDSSDLVPAEILQMVRQMPQMGGGTDIQRMLLQQMSGPKPPGGAPPGQPPQQPPGA